MNKVNRELPPEVLEKMMVVGVTLDGSELYDVIFILGTLLKMAISSIPQEHKDEVLTMVTKLISSGRSQTLHPTNFTVQ